MAPLLHRCNCCRMHPAIPYSCAICAGSCCRCNLLTLQEGLLPVRTAGRGVKIGCDILNQTDQKVLSAKMEGWKMPHTAYAIIGGAMTKGGGL